MNILKIERGTVLLQTLYYNVSSTSFSLVLVDERPDEETGQPVVYVPERINILMAVPTQYALNEAGHWLPASDSQQVRFQIMWRKVVLNNVGRLIESESTNAGQVMESVSIDVGFFLQYQGLPIVMALVNGRIRNLDGYNTSPVFDTLTGAVIQYTPEQAAAAERTWDYSEKTATGEWIHPEQHPEPEPEPEEEVTVPQTSPEDESAPE